MLVLKYYHEAQAQLVNFSCPALLKKRGVLKSPVSRI